jgi:hypothetical protein
LIPDQPYRCLNMASDWHPKGKWGPKTPEEQDRIMKVKSRFLSAVVAATNEKTPEMPWKSISSDSVRVARRLAERV